MDIQVTFYDHISLEIPLCLPRLEADLKGLNESLEKYLNASAFASTNFERSVSSNNKEKDQESSVRLF